MFKKKNIKLSYKISFIAICVLVVVLTAQTAMLSYYTRSKMTDLITKEFLNATENQAGKVEKDFIASKTVANDIATYIPTLLASEDELASDAAFAETSKIFPGKTLTFSAFKMEDYVVSTFRNDIESIPEIAGMGVFFEKNAVSSRVPSYTLYISRDDVSTGTLQDYGDYSEYGDEDWYHTPVSTASLYVTEAYEDQGIQMITVCVPIIQKGTAIGVVTVDLNINIFENIAISDEQYPSLISDLYSENFNIIYNIEDSSLVGTNLNEFIPEYIDEVKDKASSGNAFDIYTPFEGKTLHRFFSPVTLGNQTWWTMIALYTNEEMAPTNMIAILTAITAVCAVLITAVAIIITMKRLLRPLENVVRAAHEIEKGNLNIKIGSKGNDEITQLAQVFDHMTQNFRAIITGVGGALKEIGEGNFNIGISHPEIFIGDYNELVTHIDGIRHELSSTIREINITASQVDTSTEQVAAAAQALAQGSAEQSASIEELAANIGEVSQKIKLNTESAKKGFHVSTSAVEKINDSNHMMQILVSTMSDISIKSENISKIVKSIDDIAFQTNILALNAAVEAARAGVSGKGFAVVAEEVRNLAQKSAGAAKDTALLVEESVCAIKKATELTGSTGKSMGEIVVVAEGLCKINEEIANVSSEQADAVMQIDENIEKISSVVQSNSATSEETAATAEVLSNESNALKQRTNNFNLIPQ